MECKAILTESRAHKVYSVGSGFISFEPSYIVLRRDGEEKRLINFQSSVQLVCHTDDGTIYLYSGNHVRIYHSEPPCKVSCVGYGFNAMSSFGSDYFVLVGRCGAIYISDVKGIILFTENDLYAVCRFKNRYIACGNNGEIIYNDGKTSTVKSAIRETLHTIYPIGERGSEIGVIAVGRNGICQWSPGQDPVTACSGCWFDSVCPYYFSPDEAGCFAIGSDGTITQYPFRSKIGIKMISPLNSPAFYRICPIGRRFVALGDNGLIVQWSFGDKRAALIPTKERNRIHSACIINSKTIIAVNDEGTILEYKFSSWDIQNYHLHSRQQKNKIRSMMTTFSFHIFLAIMTYT